MMILRDIRRILLLVFSAAAAIGMLGFLLVLNRPLPVQDDLYLQVQPAAPLNFPFAVTGTSLVAEALVNYDGPFLEDGRGREVFNCVALLLHNTTSKEIRQVRISIQGTECWFFEAKNIPPNARILVLESSGAKLTDHLVWSCSGWEVAESNGQQTIFCLRIAHVDMGTIAVTNAGQTTLTDICLLHKNWLPGNEIYVGGITYENRIDRIEPGKTVYLQPEHYAYGYSKFIMWYTYK